MNVSRRIAVEKQRGDPRRAVEDPRRRSRFGRLWHHIRKDEAWKLLVRLGKRAWLHCDDCRHSFMIEPQELAQRHRLDMLTPRLTLKGDVLHVRSSEGTLLAGAAQ